MTTLREKMKQEMTLRGYSFGTQKSYLGAITKLYVHYNRNPAHLTEKEIKAFLLSPANQSLCVSTYNIMIHGLKFFYGVVLKKQDLAVLLPRKREVQTLPDILSASEVEQIIKATHNLKYRTLFILIYGAGLRASEAASLRVHDIDRSRQALHIRQGKGNKDRYVILSPLMLRALSIYWQQCRAPQSPSSVEQSDFVFIGTTRNKPVSTSSIGTVYQRSKHASGVKKKAAFTRSGTHSQRMHWSQVLTYSSSSNYWVIPA